jgi:signal transduction histidine kinase
MSLAGTARLDDLSQLHDRVDRAVDDLDSTITEIRTSIFELGETSLPAGLRHAVVHLADELTSTLGSRPEVRFVGQVDNAVPLEVGDHILAVVREALTNAAKHAQASHFSIEISVDDDVVNVEVVDNGNGLLIDRAGSAGHGLMNMRSRAEKLNGTFEIFSVEGQGTRLSWSVPV